jgi:hypothetical protein
VGGGGVAKAPGVRIKWGRGSKYEKGQKNSDIFTFLFHIFSMCHLLKFSYSDWSLIEMVKI